MNLSHCVLAVLLAAWAFAGLARATDRLAVSDQQARQLGITLGSPEHIRVVPVLSAPARVTLPPEQEIVIGAPQPGIVTTVKVDAGDPVIQNQLLAEIASPQYLELQREFLDRLLEQKLAEFRLEKNRMLHQEGLISKTRWLETESAFERQRIHLRETRAMLAISGMSRTQIARLESGQRLLPRLQIRAPGDAVVLERSISPNQRVDLLSPLFRLAKLDKLWLELRVSQQRVGEIQTGYQVTLPGLKKTARIRLIARSVDPDNQTVMVRAELVDPPDTLRIGQKLTVRVLRPVPKQRLSIPTSALVRRGGNTYVFAKTRDGFEVRPVQALGQQGPNTVIGAGLEGNERVVVRGAAALKAAWMGIGGGE